MLNDASYHMDCYHFTPPATSNRRRRAGDRWRRWRLACQMACVACYGLRRLLRSPVRSPATNEARDRYKSLSVFADLII